MPEMTSYEPGTPCWVDLATPDVGAATEFYTGLFGWQPVVTPNSEVAGHTTMTLDGDVGRPVAALLPQHAVIPAGTPAIWTTYVAVADVDATAEAARDAGGRVFLGPADVGEQGRFAMLFDPQGAHIGLLQLADFSGAAIVNEPGTYCWSELGARDVERAAAFYGAMLGWEADSHPFGAGTYTGWRNPGGPSIAGMVQMDEPGENAPYWLVYFAVPDCDATVSRAGDLGGTTLAPPSDLPIGRFAVLRDPQGGHFGVIRLSR